MCRDPSLAEKPTEERDVQKKKKVDKTGGVGIERDMAGRRRGGEERGIRKADRACGIQEHTPMHTIRTM